MESATFHTADSQAAQGAAGFEVPSPVPKNKGPVAFMGPLSFPTWSPQCVSLRTL